MTLLKKLSNQVRNALMAKNAKKKGRSARNGNSPSPYAKYKKTPFLYSQEYRDWRRDALARRTHTPKPVRDKEYKMAAE